MEDRSVHLLNHQSTTSVKGVQLCLINSQNTPMLLLGR